MVAIGRKGLVQRYVYNQRYRHPLTATSRRDTSERDVNDIVNLLGKIRHEQTLKKPDLRTRYKAKAPKLVYLGWGLQSLLSVIGMYREYICQNGSAIDVGISLGPNISYTVEYPDQVRERLKRFDVRLRLDIEYLANLLRRRYGVGRIGPYSTMY